FELVEQRVVNLPRGVDLALDQAKANSLLLHPVESFLLLGEHRAERLEIHLGNAHLLLKLAAAIRNELVLRRLHQRTNCGNLLVNLGERAERGIAVCLQSELLQFEFCEAVSKTLVNRILRGKSAKVVIVSAFGLRAKFTETNAFFFDARSESRHGIDGGVARLIGETHVRVGTQAEEFAL